MNPGQTLFTGVAQRIDEISLGSHTAGDQKSQEQVGEGGVCKCPEIAASRRFDLKLKATLINLRTPNLLSYGPASGEQNLLP